MQGKAHPVSDSEVRLFSDVSVFRYNNDSHSSPRRKLSVTTGVLVATSILQRTHGSRSAVVRE
jgi:hypothetical protein